MGETTGSLYDQRLKRTMDAVQCKVPDRVPTLVDFGYYAAKHGGISVEEAAGLLGISRATAYRNWTYARAWVRRQILDGDGSTRG